MAQIVLTTLNAKYIHAAFGLRYLMANLGELQPRAKMLEFDISHRPIDVVESILAHDPKIVGIGVYIWNATQSAQLVAELKRVRPDVVVILGGPEVSYETDQQEICRLADFVITGEADLAFAQVCEKLLSGRRPLQKVIAAELPEFSNLRLPYDLYNEKDAAHRVIYVEASRGCPFKCEFCLSSLDVPVRNAPLGNFLEAMQGLLDRGVRQFKFVDRTFNLNANIGKSILQFFFERYVPGLFLHFEMIPDRLPDALREWIKKFPPGALQFEVGIQTFNEDVCARISRRQDNVKVAENFAFLRNETGVHMHADLIVGLPGETMESFGEGFDRLVALRPQEIQVGILKRLRGTPIVRHDREFGMVYSPHPPYEILQTRDVDFNTMQRLRRFARYWDLIANSGNFIETTPLIWRDDSPFESFMRLTDWLFEALGQTHSIPLHSLMELMLKYLTPPLAVSQYAAQPAAKPQAAPPAASNIRDAFSRTESQVIQTIWRDYQRGGRSDLPRFLRDRVEPPSRRLTLTNLPRRQARHLA